MYIKEIKYIRKCNVLITIILDVIDINTLELRGHDYFIIFLQGTCCLLSKSEYKRAL
jgi:hypothetical protein